MNQLKERLKNVRLDPLYTSSTTDDVTKEWQKDLKLKIYISDTINSILKELYNPLDMWKQNPSVTNRVDFGVVIDGEWSSLNQINTNYSSHTYLLNQTNLFLVNLYKKKGLEQIIIDDDVFTYKNLFYFDYKTPKSEIWDKLSKFFKLIRNKKESVFGIGSQSYQRLIEICDNTMDIGNKAQQFYEKDIHFFFPDLVSFKSSNGKGNYDDRTQGIDVWKVHDNYLSTDQVKLVSSAYFNGEDYIINTVISLYSKTDFYVFVVNYKKILIFRNDSLKISFSDGKYFFPKELFYKEKEYV